ncbi:Transposon TX1 uncharacterized 149 kDa protein [Linum perenne]
MYRLKQKLKESRHLLFHWPSTGVTNSARTIRELERKISSAKSQNSIDWETVLQLEFELADATRKEEMYWQLRGRENWLQKGDQNTSFFHISVAQRRYRNQVTSLKDDNGVLHSSPAALGNIATQFYQNIFKTSQPPTNLSNIFPIQDFLPRIKPEWNEELTKPITPLCVHQAIFSIGGSQAPGSDGFTCLFFQQYWDIVGPDLTTVVIDFFSSTEMLKAINHTWVTLIPKVQKVEHMSQLRPIGLCTVVYKVISKILSKQLAEILPNIISETQNGFIKGRSITDNILISHEVTHFIRRYKKGKKKFIALKLDMEKTYDRVEWTFLLNMMRLLVFNEKWIAWIHTCLSSSTLTILLNGQPQELISPTRGLRQGDPLSPLLFAIFFEGL